jgi:hypothetical protein
VIRRGRLQFLEQEGALGNLWVRSLSKHVIVDCLLPCISAWFQLEMHSWDLVKATHGSCLSHNSFDRKTNCSQIHAGLLMKLNPAVGKLALYDVAGTAGVAADISHINTTAEVL